MKNNKDKDNDPETKGIEFYNLLFNSDEFTSELGKVVLASGKLEAELINLLLQNNIKGNFKKATLGSLIRKAEESNILTKNEVEAYRLISRQRNYLTHNIYALFNYLIEETILERENLIDSDVKTFQEKAWQLKENLNGLSELVKNKKTTHNNV